MNAGTARGFVWHWLRYAIRDAATQAFGWPTVLSAALLGYLLPKIGIGTISNPIANNVAIASVSWAIGFGVYLFAALFKAYYCVAPLTVNVTDDGSDGTC
jgi:hypothetical protein